MKGYGQKRYLQKTIGLVEKNDPSTTQIVLNGFHIVDAKLAVLAMALVNNTHVKRLHLDGNSITDRGAGLLAYALQQNNTLVFLSLNDNNIRSFGADAIATAMYENKTLRTLRLANNSIGDHGGKKLRRMLRHNASIRAIFLDGNSISQKSINKFDDRCKSISTMKESACDNTAASTTGSDFTPSTDSEADTESAEKNRDQEEEGAELNASEFGWASLSLLSLFGSSLYLDNDDARKYILGCDGGDSMNASSSWNNLASYIMKVQRKKDKSEEEEENQDDNDDLSVASEPDQVVAQEEKKKKKKWAIFKRTRSDKEIHAQK